MGLTCCAEQHVEVYGIPRKPKLRFLYTHFHGRQSWMTRVTPRISPTAKTWVVASAITEMLAIAR